MQSGSSTSIYEKTFHEQLKRLAKLNFEVLADRIGAAYKDGAISLPFFHETYTVSIDGIMGKAGRVSNHAVRTVLCQYLLRFPAIPPKQNDWTSFKDFRDAAPLVGYFKNCEHSVSKYFSGKKAQLLTACLFLHGRVVSLFSGYELTVIFDVLPHLPLLLLYNDQDDEFPAHCNFLFKSGAQEILDMESLAIVGKVLADRVIAIAQRSEQRAGGS